mmetsp:Transcript_8654/g.14664  ORF Transcript_8654/g.14664 Transcript_8654/m.14664 type:complete len:100 (+) Transcript_8654:805-1104(+)
MLKNNYNTIGITSNERSQLSGIISQQSVVRFLVNHYSGQISFFKHRFSKFASQNQSYFAKNKHLVKCQHSDSLFQVLQQMRDSRISIILVERTFQLEGI